MDENFLLNSETAKQLFHQYAADLPIVDYHCHLSPQEIYENRSYKNMTELWLAGDHYKWRAMRANGIDEHYITGEADDYEKFEKWAETVEKLIGNPLYHWTHMELRQYFGVYHILKKDTAKEIWETCNEKLQTQEFTARGFITRSNVEIICTTDDPLDDLNAHELLKKEKDFSTKVLPTFRPDKVLSIQEEAWSSYIDALGQVTGQTIRTFSELVLALEKRVHFFNEVGCRLSDHSLEPVVYEDATLEELDQIVRKALNRETVSEKEFRQFTSCLLVSLGQLYSEHDWVMQLHIGALRNVNSRLFQSIGANVGGDSMRDDPVALPLARLLDAMDQSGQLPKTILYGLNPRDNEMLAAMAGNFQEGGTIAKMQFGTAWWFNDHREGMISQMKALSNIGLLSRFIGMLTDSRSFLSYSRHEYFRRILCQLIGEWVENGEYPNDIEGLGKIVQDISYYNAVAYLKLNENANL